MSCGGVCSSCRILHSNGLWTGIWSPSTWFALVMLKLSLPKQKALDGMLNGRPVYVLWVVPQAHKEICPPRTTGHLLSGEALSFHQVAQITKRPWNVLRAHLYVMSEDFSAAEYWGTKMGARVLPDRRHYTPSQQRLLPMAPLLDACMKKSRREIWGTVPAQGPENCVQCCEWF